MKCPHCGKELSDQAGFCQFCGKPVEQNTTPEQPRQEKIPVWQPPAGNGTKTSPGQEKMVWVIAALALLLVVIVVASVVLGGKNKTEEPAPSSAAVYQQDQPASAPERSETPVSSEPASRPEPAESQPAESEPEPAASLAASSAASEAEPVWGQQEILVTPSGSGTAVLTLRQKYGDDWETLYQCTAAIGRNGTTTNPREGDGKTPAGTFPVEFCYGLKQPETGIPFLQVGPDSVWVDDGASPYYNCLTTLAEAGDVSHEDTYSQFTRGFYTVNLFFANNGDGRTPGSAAPGAGSVRVLEGYTRALEPTNGDIKIASEDMEQLLQRLDAGYDPVVTVLES